ncbi:hypothetical protein ACOME3_000091 [Neoechinorhynchus agilis]
MHRSKCHPILIGEHYVMESEGLFSYQMLMDAFEMQAVQTFYALTVTMENETQVVERFIFSQGSAVSGFPYDVFGLSILTGTRIGEAYQSIPLQENLLLFIAVSTNSYRVMALAFARWTRDELVSDVNHHTVDFWCAISRDVGDLASYSFYPPREFKDKVSLGVPYLDIDKFDCYESGVKMFVANIAWSLVEANNLDGFRLADNEVVTEKMWTMIHYASYRAGERMVSTFGGAPLPRSCPHGYDCLTANRMLALELSTGQLNRFRFVKRPDITRYNTLKLAPK